MRDKTKKVETLSVNFVKKSTGFSVDLHGRIHGPLTFKCPYVGELFEMLFRPLSMNNWW